MAFASGSALTVTWAELAEGREIEVCNGTAAAVTPVVKAIEFKAGDGDGSTVAVVKIDPAPSIADGQCTPITVRRVGRRSQGMFTGALVATAAGAGVARLELTVEGDETAPEAAQVKGAVDEATLTALSGPFSNSVLEDGGDLLLKGPTDEQKSLQIGKGCNPSGDEWSSEDCEFIGNLYNGDDIVHLYVGGELKSDKGVVRLPVRISPEVRAIGVYEGSLDPAGTDDPEQMIKVKLTGSDRWQAALAAVVIGALLALALQLISDRFRPQLRLRRRRAQVVDDYADDNRPRAVPNYPTIKADRKKVGGYLADVKKATGTYLRGVLFVDSESDAYKAIDESLSLAEEDAGVLSGEDGLSASLDALADELKATKEMLEDSCGLAGTPYLVGAATAPFSAGDLGVGEATERAACAAELTEALQGWSKLAKRILGYGFWVAALWEHDHNGDTPPLAAKDREVLIEVSIAQVSLGEELLRAEGSADLERLRASGRLESTFGMLSYLGGRYGVGQPEGSAVRVEVLERVKLAGAELMPPRFRAFLDKFVPGSRQAGEWEAWGLDEGDATPAQIPAIRGGLIAIDVFLLLAGLIPACFAALTASTYFDMDSFGTVRDYATLIIAGTAGQVLVKFAQDHFEVFAHDIRAGAPPVPATAVPAVPEKTG